MSLTLASERAYATFEIKAVHEDERIIEGFASTPSLDRGGDVMDPAGAKFALPMPLLWQHQQDKPLGHVFDAKVTPRGIYIKARIASGVLPFIDEAWSLIKSRLVRGFSIGWKPLERPEFKDGAARYSNWEMFEVSAVTVPMNRDTTILAVKALDAEILAALGTGTRVHSPNTPGATGLRKGVAMTLSERVAATQADLKTKHARFSELSEQSESDGGLNAEETTEFSSLGVAIKGLTGQLDNLKIQESAEAALASPVSVIRPQAKAAAPAGAAPKVEVKTHPKGTIFTRYALAIGAGKGSHSDTLAYAKRFTDTPEVAAYVKAMWDQKAIEGTSVVGSPAWGGELVNPNTAQTEFVELVNHQTIIGKTPGLRRVPFNIPIITQTGGSTFEWVNEGGVKPVGELAFERDTLGHSKCAGIVVMTEELTRLSTPSSEATARQDLIDQCAKFLDEQFIQVAVTAGSEHPASITNGVSSPSATGTTAAALKHDLRIAISSITASGVSAAGLVLVMTPDLALGISLLETDLGQTPSGINMSPTGGTILGYPVIVSESVDSGTIVVFKPSEIFLADDGQVRLDASNQATLDMAGGNSPTFSLWQRNCVGIRAERWIHWKKRRPTVVAVIDTASYGPS